MLYCIIQRCDYNPNFDDNKHFVFFTYIYIEYIIVVRNMPHNRPASSAATTTVPYCAPLEIFAMHHQTNGVRGGGAFVNDILKKNSVQQRL